MAGDSEDQQRPEASARFAALLQRLGLAEHFDRVFQRLIDGYSEPGRHYHTLGHVMDCLGALDETSELLEDLDAAELALWFHDVVYDPAARDNELRSALMFDRELGVQLPSPFADKVRTMIMATVHPSAAVDHDAQLVADIDLAGLALPWTEFRHDTELLRRESSHLTVGEFQFGTLGFFAKLMSRPSIYLTDYFRAHYGTQARKNIVALTVEMEDDLGDTAPAPGATSGASAMD